VSTLRVKILNYQSFFMVLKEEYHPHGETLGGSSSLILRREYFIHEIDLIAVA